MFAQNYENCPIASGLSGGNNSCYFNSLVQSLMTCSAFNESLETDRSYLAKEYRAILAGKSSTADLLSSVNRARNSLQWNISPGQQEDAHEGFILLMELLKNHVHVFGHRYNLDMICIRCENKVVVPAESCPVELVIEVPAGVNMQNYIRSHIQKLSDYKCGKCNSKETVQRYQIARLSSVMVVVFKNNQARLSKKKSKQVQTFDKQLEFSSIYGTIVYDLVSVIEQFGSFDGGHYTATCVRPTSQHTTEIFTFDDSRFAKSSFAPSPNVYMLWYALST